MATKRINVRVSEETYAELVLWAEAENRTPANLAASILTDEMKGRDE